MTKKMLGSMKNILVVVLTVFASVFAMAQANPSSITIGFLPGGDVNETKNGAVEIAQALQDELGVSVNVFISKNYAGLAEAMKNKKIDFAFFTAMSYVVSEKETGAKVLLKNVWVEPFYYSTILVKKNSPIKKVEDLKGKSIAFVDERSTSGYLYPQVYLKKKKFDLKGLKSQKMSGSHSQSVDALDKGEVDAIAVFADDKDGKINAYQKYSKVKNGDVRPIWTSDPIPNDPFCVRQDFYDQYPKLTHSLMFSLIDVVDKLKEKKEIQKLVGTKGFMPATAKQYDPVREVVKEMGVQ